MSKAQQSELYESATILFIESRIAFARAAISDGDIAHARTILAQTASDIQPLAIKDAQGSADKLHYHAIATLLLDESAQTKDTVKYLHDLEHAVQQSGFTTRYSSDIEYQPELSNKILLRDEFQEDYHLPSILCLSKCVQWNLERKLKLEKMTPLITDFEGSQNSADKAKILAKIYNVLAVDINYHFVPLSLRHEILCREIREKLSRLHVHLIEVSLTEIERGLRFKVKADTSQMLGSCSQQLKLLKAFRSVKSDELLQLQQRYYGMKSAVKKHKTSQTEKYNSSHRFYPTDKKNRRDKNTPNGKGRKRSRGHHF